MTDERIDQLITSYKRRVEELKSRAHMCDAESNQYLDVMDAWQEADDIISCLEELKRLREEYNELDKLHGDMFADYSYTMKALNLACEELMHKNMKSWCECKCMKCKHYPDDCVNHLVAIRRSLLQKAREQE